MIVPAFNAGQSLERALRSALATDRLVECIVVDDGSTDDTAAVAERLAAADPRIVALRLASNEGVSRARNRALAVARGEWLIFLEADDRLLPLAVERLLDAAADGDALAVVGQRVWTDGRRRWQAASYCVPDIRQPGRKSLAGHPGLMAYAAPTGKLFHRSIAEGLRFEGRVLGDQPWTIRALIRADDRIQVIGDLVYEWRRPVGGAPSTITAAKRASSRLAAAAARVAVGALAEVSAEADARIVDPEARRRVVGGYFERLVRLDLAGPVRRAVTRNDPGAAELFEAIAAFLDSAPAGLVDRSTRVAEDLLRAPLDRWPSLREPARTAYLQLLRHVLAAHPGLARRMGHDLVPLAVRLLRTHDRGLAHAAARLLLTLNWPLGAARRLARYRPPRILRA